ncbi:FadR/GntR family transcriptional regulator [Skermanella stibiiresistens]|jgi:DNA-binding FadR family transcriptional regulator|uniref:FadR/GntR family transcriptional regulator n=1 Tax=Skermanella stibiiresistens TaxID=913326 RepID=UPI00056B7A6A|nr:FadR/GntR family transcriptional regulator [Skermanella stibiiresistens]
MNGVDPQGTLTQLRALLAQAPLSVDSRLPPERDLCQQLGVSRGELRKALATLEAEGQLWRHVGKGTFIGSRPTESLADLSVTTSRTNPAEVMQTRLLIEPEIARVAALNATAADIAEMRTCMARSRSAATWRQYESWDNRLHRLIAESTRNTLLLAMFDTLNAVRRAVVWGRLRVNRTKPDPGHHSYAEHEEVVAAIADRDMDRAARMMRQHLQTVERKLLNQQQ